MRTIQNFLRWERHTYAPQLVKAYIKLEFGHVTIAGDKNVRVMVSSFEAELEPTAHVNCHDVSRIA